MEKLFIFNCHGEIVGNPKGYATFKGASRWAHTRAMQNLLWATFEGREDKTTTQVWSIGHNFQA